MSDTTETKRPQTLSAPKFYQKVSFAYSIVAIMITALLSGIGGFHMAQQLEHKMQQEFANGVASVKPVQQK